MSAPAENDALDADGDGTPDDCDACPDDVNDDRDGDGSCDSDDLCTGDDGTGDSDSDGWCNDTDDCPDDVDADQADADGDGTGDVCEPDTHDDGVIDDGDACPGTAAGAVVDANGCSGAQEVDAAWSVVVLPRPWRVCELRHPRRYGCARRRPPHRGREGGLRPRGGPREVTVIPYGITYLLVANHGYAFSLAHAMRSPLACEADPGAREPRVAGLPKAEDSSGSRPRRSALLAMVHEPSVTNRMPASRLPPPGGKDGADALVMVGGARDLERSKVVADLGAE
jgi:hypothetical protein